MWAWVRLPTVEKYGKDHPEYFSEIRGRRRLSQTQLCTTNPEVREIACSNLFAAIRKEPDADVWGIGQNDYYFYCECRNCAAVDAREESHCGAVLEFVNFLADRVNSEFPGKLIKFSAYQFTRKPPKYLRPATNVVINLCAIECDFARPFGQAGGFRENLDFESDFATWSRIATRMSAYDYTTNYRHYMHPFPNLETIAGNIRYYRDHGVKILYCEGGCAHADLAELKPWLIAKLSWNPDRDLNELVETFCRGHYGRAAPNVLDYIRSSRACITAKPGTRLSIFEGSRPSVYTDEFLDRQMENFRKAEQAVIDDPDRLHNVRMTGAVVYATKLDHLVDRTKFWWATEHPEAFDEPTGAAEMLEWMMKREAEAESKGDGFVLCANRGKEAQARLRWSRLAAWKRPSTGSAVGFVPALEMTPATPNNGFHGGWFVREVADGEAHAGKAAEINCDFQKCVLSFNLQNVALDARARYRVRVRVRGTSVPGSGGEAFAILTTKGVECLSVPAASITESWKWHDVGEIQASDAGGYEMHVGRVDRGGDGSVKTLVVDGVEFAKMGK